MVVALEEAHRMKRGKREKLLHIEEFPDDEELVERIKQGDEKAFEILMTKHKRRVFMIAFHSTKNYEDAEDITQEVFFRAYRSIPSWEPRANFSTWLYKVTTNLCIDYHRARVRRRMESVDDEESKLPDLRAEDLASDPEKVTEENEIRRIINKAIEENLSGRQRDAFILYHYGGLQVKEVAEVLGVAEGTVKMHLFRAMTKLRKALKPLRDKGEI